MDCRDFASLLLASLTMPALLLQSESNTWQPDIHRGCGHTELLRIAALSAAYDIAVISTTNSPWSELFMPPPGGPEQVYRRFEEDSQITRGA